MDIRNPEYFLEIARQKNVTRAAEKLGISRRTLLRRLAEKK